MVRLIAASFVALAAAGCVDTTKCHTATEWKPCAGEAAQAGASGTPPSIVELSLPTCVSINAPTVTGTLRVTDPDGDAQVLKATLYIGQRNTEDEQQLADSLRSGNDWSGTIAVVLQGAGGGEQVAFDTFATDGLDGFDFTITLEPVEFDLQADGFSRPEIVFFPATDAGGAISSPASMPFDLTTN